MDPVIEVSHEELVACLLCAGWEEMTPEHQRARHFCAKPKGHDKVWISSDIKSPFVMITPPGQSTMQVLRVDIMVGRNPDTPSVVFANADGDHRPRMNLPVFH